MTARPLLPCGTYAAWQRHYKAGEEPCPEDVQAKREYQAARRKKVGRPDLTTSRMKAYQRARSRALHRLARTYDAAFAGYLAEELAKEEDYR